MHNIKTWDDYRTRVREFDAVLEHAKALGNTLAALQATTLHAVYGEQVFIKLLTHCMALRALAVDPSRRTPSELWNVTSMCAIARCVVEAHDAFEYIAGHDVTPAERGFRTLLWELHDQTRRLKLPGASNKADVQAEVYRLQTALEHHEFLPDLRTELREELLRRITKGEPPAFHLSQRQRCVLSSVNADWYGDVTLRLSQYVHTLPSSVRELERLDPDTPEALNLMAMPLLATLPFLARTTLGMTQLMLGKAPSPPSRTGRTMQLWRTLAERGEWPAE